MEADLLGRGGWSGGTSSRRLFLHTQIPYQLEQIEDIGWIPAPVASEFVTLKGRQHRFTPESVAAVLPEQS
jgi:hypothetical protein